MMRLLGAPLPHDNTPGPSIENLTPTDFDRLRDLVREEAQEFCDAMDYLEESINLKKRTNGEKGQANIMDAWAQVIDGMCDTIVVIHNTACAMNLDLEPFFNEVHRTNLAKVGGPVREDGKRLKPEGWQPPDILGLLKDQLRRYSEMKPDRKKKHSPYYTKNPWVALLYELARDYIYYEGLEQLIKHQKSDGWHLTDNLLAVFAEDMNKELAEQAHHAKLGKTLVVEDFGDGHQIVTEMLEGETEREAKRRYAKFLLQRQHRLEAGRAKMMAQRHGINVDYGEGVREEEKIKDIDFNKVHR